MQTSKERELYDTLFQKCVKELTPLTYPQMSDKVFNWYNNHEISIKMAHELTRYIADLVTLKK